MSTTPLAFPELTAADHDTFAEKGYWVSGPVIDADQVSGLREAHERIWAGDFDGDGFPRHGNAALKSTYEPNRLRKLDNGWWINDAVRTVVTDGRIGQLCAELLGCERVRLWHDQVIYKPPTGEAGQVGNVGWHQDYGYWHASDTQEMITVWIALQDTDLENGGMRSIAGSHKWGLIEDSDTFFDQDLEGLEAKYGHLGEWADEPCLIASGGASFHHSLTFHGSGANQTDQARLSVVAHVMPDGTGYSAAEQWHGNVSLLGPRPRKGQRFEGAYFPVLDG